MDPLTTIIRGLLGKKAVDTATKAINSETAKNVANDAVAGAEMAAQNAYNAGSSAINWLGDTAKNLSEGASKILNDATEKGKSAFNKALDGYFKMLGLGYKDGQIYSPSVERAISKAMGKDENDIAALGEVLQALENNTANNKQAEDAAEESETVESTIEKTDDKEKETEDEDVITYTYKPGDTFGQVLLNLGLSDASRLWGRGGDVEYYTQQLREQDMLDPRGNVKIGVPFRLRRRR